jgi:hypothetical protein
MTSPLLDYEAFQWVTPGPIRANPPPIKRPGIAEIKPHTKSGIAAGERQLRGRRGIPSHYDRWLVTYRLVVPPSRSGPGRAQVLAYRVTPGKPREGPWDLGVARIPATIPFPRPTNPAFFGMAIEGIVRGVFKQALPKGAAPLPGTGGARRGVDVRWNELAYFYNELASETADPFYRELAAELMEMATVA